MTAHTVTRRSFVKAAAGTAIAAPCVWTVCHQANIGYRLRRPLKWDPKREQFVADDEANKLLMHQPREPWSYT